MTSKNTSGRVNAQQLTTFSRDRLAEAIQARSAELDHTVRKAIPDILGTMLQVMKETFWARGSIRLRGIGCLAIMDKDERGGARNPATGQQTIVEAHTTVTLRDSAMSYSEELPMSGLISKVKDKHSAVSSNDIRHVYRTLVGMISGIEQGATRIEIRGFGTFYPSHQKGQKRRNPNNGEAVYTEDHFKVRFKVSKALAGKIPGPDAEPAKRAA